MTKINGPAVDLAIKEGHLIMNFGKNEPIWHMIATLLTLTLCALLLFK
jgi:hypothetical protein